MSSRSSRGLREPGDLTGFPARTVRRNTRLYRAHNRDRGPWWFGSAGEGRFDLPAPEGTCYVAGDAKTALRERLGPRIVRSGIVQHSELERTVVSRLLLPAPITVADATNPDAYAFGCTTEISTLDDLGLTRRWAAAFWQHGRKGMRYAARLAPGAVSIALFGNAGDRDWPVDPDPPAATDPALQLGLTVVRAPAAAELTFTSPQHDRR